jgi:effector-binding domain-containing protein
MMKDIKVVNLQPMKCMAIEQEVENDKIPMMMVKMFQELSIFFQKNRLSMAGPPFAYYYSWSDQKTHMSVGFPVTDQIEGDSRVGPFMLPGGDVVNAMHIGPYDKLVESYMAMQGWMTKNHLKPAGYMWEAYLSDPDKEKDSEKWMTDMYWPCLEEKNSP